MIDFNWKRYIGLFFLSAGLILMFVVIWRSLLLSEAGGSPFSLRLVIKSDTPQITKLYYNLGEGFSEKNTVVSDLPGDGRFHKCSFSIPRQSIQGFRFDPSMSTASMVIKKADIMIEIAGGFTMVVKRIDLHDLKPANQIKKFTMQSDQLIVVTADNADDPQIALPVAVTFDTWYESDFFLLLIRLILKIAALDMVSMGGSDCGCYCADRLDRLWFEMLADLPSRHESAVVERLHPIFDVRKIAAIL